MWRFDITDIKIKKFLAFPLPYQNKFVSLRCKMRAHVRTMQMKQQFINMPMKLKEGSYENLITNELQQDMNLATDNGLVCRKEDIDNAEAPSMLTEHISRIIHNRLTADDLTSEERTDFVNRLIDFLEEDAEEKIADEKQIDRKSVV